MMMLHAFLNCLILHCAIMDSHVWQRFLLRLFTTILTFYFQFSTGMLAVISVVIVNSSTIVGREKRVRG
jgi:hypothetical protein